MSIINLKERTINAKIVYYGTALGGKTTSLKHVHRVVDPEQKVELLSLNTEKDRTLFFDFLPIPLGRIGQFTVRLQGFTVPGQVKYNLTRKYVLTGADAVILVVDSSRGQLENNLAALENLKENLAANGIDYRTIPLVLQLNKQDLPDVVPSEELNRLLNDRRVPAFETVATEGRGVFEAFTDVSRRMLDHISGQYRIEGGQTSMGEILERTLSRFATAGPSPAIGAPVPSLIAADEDTGKIATSEDLLRRSVDSNIEFLQRYSDVNEMKNRLRDRVRELTVLCEYGRAVGSLLDEDRLLQATLDAATTSLGVSHASLLLVTADGSRLVEKVVKGLLRDPLCEAVLAPGGESLLFRLVQGPGLRATAEEEPQVLERVRRHDSRVTALLTAPLTIGDRLAGLLVAYSMEDAWSDGVEQHRFLSALAGQAAVALQNARLVDRIEGLNRDLEQKVEERTEKLRTALRELKEVDRLKDEFLSTISHELLTPLTSIRSFSEILIATRGGSLPEPLPEFLSIIHHEALRLTERLSLLLDVSRIEAGKATFCHEPVDLMALAEEALEAQSDGFRKKGIQPGLLAAPNLPKIHGDRAWLARALAALLGNALKFSAPGSRIEVEIRLFGQEVRVSVVDEGPGIALDLQPVIFERFRQLGDILTGKPAGIGLGLPLCRLVVGAHGGRIWVESRPGEGAKFTMALPLAPVPVAGNRLAPLLDGQQPSP
jgi:signal transduction histidine kinase/signal recognition particle receptor subunit beta